jgi:hypothetical protein
LVFNACHVIGRQSASLSKNKLAGSLLLGTAASSAPAVGALSGAGAANASCASLSGAASGGRCTTTSIGDTAIGIGTGDVVAAEGGFNTAIAIGTGAVAGGRPADVWATTLAGWRASR